MNFIRKIVKSDDLEKGIRIPEELKHRNVELLIIPLEDESAQRSEPFDPQEYAGVLHIENLEAEINSIRNEWERL